MVRGSCHAKCLPMAQRWGNRPAFLWIAEDFWVLRFRLMVKRGHRGYGPQASEGEAQHGLFCWTGCIGQGDQRLYCGCWTPRRAASVEFEESEVVAARPTLRASLPLDVFAHVVWSDIGRIDAAHCIDGDAGGTRNLRIVLIAD